MTVKRYEFRGLAMLGAMYEVGAEDETDSDLERVPLVLASDYDALKAERDALQKDAPVREHRLYLATTGPQTLVLTIRGSLEGIRTDPEPDDIVMFKHRHGPAPSPDYKYGEAERDALRQAQKWQPMSTVPRDRYVLLLSDEPTWAGNVECGKWFPPDDHDPAHGEFWSAGGPNGGLEVGGMKDFIGWQEAPPPPPPPADGEKP